MRLPSPASACRSHTARSEGRAHLLPSGSRQDCPGRAAAAPKQVPQQAKVNGLGSDRAAAFRGLPPGRAGLPPGPAGASSCPLEAGRGDRWPVREHRHVRQIPGGLGYLALCGGREGGIKTRVEFIEGQPALCEVLAQGRGTYRSSSWRGGSRVLTPGNPPWPPPRVCRAARQYNDPARPALVGEGRGQRVDAAAGFSHAARTRPGPASRRRVSAAAVLAWTMSCSRVTDSASRRRAVHARVRGDARRPGHG